MKTKLILLASIAVLFGSCQKEAVSANGSVMATIASDEDKTNVNNLAVTWAAGDQICIAYMNNGLNNAKYNLNSGSAGKKVGLFEGDAFTHTGSCYAFYPYVKATTSGGFRFSYAVEASQEASKGLGAYLPMYSKSFKLGDHIQFNHLVSALKITVTPSAPDTFVSSIIISRSSGYSPDGSFNVINGSITSLPKSANTSITLTINESISVPTDYYIAVFPVPGTSKWDVSVNYSDSKKKRTIVSLTKLEAGKLYTGSFKI